MRKAHGVQTQKPHTEYPHVNNNETKNMRRSGRERSRDLCDVRSVNPSSFSLSWFAGVFSVSVAADYLLYSILFYFVLSLLSPPAAVRTTNQRMHPQALLRACMHACAHARTLTVSPSPTG
ncbi:hypothetical protein BDN70DRAFT_134345 [Pholiota conissans]|uniref:Uncharacterized protein n=1 Tax=Pholiota conissans TaxID=109636 RepID=A0A9P6CRF9_9AGAR|nr:hypothetical protein BDN70DRAFT_134345 [Pholiota conissans]